jgi:hypothetical protein
LSTKHFSCNRIRIRTRSTGTLQTDGGDFLFGQWKRQMAKSKRDVWMTNKGHKTFGTAPLDREASDRVWRQNERYLKSFHENGYSQDHHSNIYNLFHEEK